MDYWTGIGSRHSPTEILDWMTQFGQQMAKAGWWLRSGAAKGADQAFEQGAGEQSDIYLPWDGFEGRHSGRLMRPSKTAYQIASEHHPVWPRLNAGVRALLARDVHQVLGDDCHSLTKFVVCWTPDGATTAAETSFETGGTGMAIRIADTYKVPVWNLMKSLTPPDAIQSLGVNEHSRN